MKHIRFKVKHLLVIALLVILVLNHSTLLILGSKAIGMVSPDLERKILTSIKVTNIFAADLKLESLLENNRFLIYNPVAIERGSTTAGSRIRLKDGMEVLEQFNRLSEKESNNSLFPTYAKNVSLILWFAVLTDEAVDIIYDIKYDTLSPKERDELRIIKAGFDLSLIRFDNALSHLEKVTKYYSELQEELIWFASMLKNDSRVTPRDANNQNINPNLSDRHSLHNFFLTINTTAYPHHIENVKLDEERFIYRISNN